SRSVAKYSAEAARAYLLRARHDSAAAVRSFMTLSDTLCLRCDTDRLTTARLLEATHRSAAADKILRQRIFSAIAPIEVLMALDRGKVAESLGQKDVARRCYRLVVDAWSRGDPEAQTFAREAKRRLVRIGGS